VAVHDNSSPQLVGPQGNYIIQLSTAPQVFLPWRMPPMLTFGNSYSYTFAPQGGNPPYMFTTWQGSGPNLQTIQLTAAGVLQPVPQTLGVINQAWGTRRLSVTFADSSSPPLSLTTQILYTIQSPLSDWRRITGIVLRPRLDATTSDSLYCAPLLAAGDLTPRIGMNHLPPYDGLYKNSPLVANGNQFNVGWVNTSNHTSPWPTDAARVFTSTDNRIMGGHQPTFSGSLKWQVGTSPGTYNVWLAAWSKNGGTLTIKDSLTTLKTITIPQTAGGVTPTAIVDATGALYSPISNWSAVTSAANSVTGTWGGTPVQITTADTSNGNGGPMLYFDCGANSVGLSYVAVQLVEPPGTLLDTLTLPTGSATQDLVVYGQGNWRYADNTPSGGGVLSNGIGVTDHGYITYNSSGRRMQALWTGPGTFPADMYVEATVGGVGTSPIGAYLGPSFRASSDNGHSGFYCGCDTKGTWFAMWYIGGGDTEAFMPGMSNLNAPNGWPQNAQGFAIQVGDVLRYGIKNNTIFFLKNGILYYMGRVPATGSTPRSPQLITHGVPGIYAHDGTFGLKNLTWGPT
jgi:hypothetical protein